MKNKFLYIFFVFIFFGCSLYSQTIDTLQLRVQYKSTYKTTLEDEISSDTHLLDIGKHTSHFYSQRYKIFKHEYDSITNSNPDPSAMVTFVRSMYDKEGESYELWKNVPNVGKYTFYDSFIQSYFFYYVDDITTPKWELGSDEKAIAGFTCYKAKCNYKGRKWTAYYTLDIPYNNGPWLLGGLPGLIMSASDGSGIFSFVCTGIEQENKKIIPMVLDLSGYEKTTRKDFLKLLKDYWLDQTNTMGKLDGEPYQEPPKEEKSFTACPLDNED